jgi:hypothetical protein
MTFISSTVGCITSVMLSARHSFFNCTDSCFVANCTLDPIWVLADGAKSVIREFNDGSLAFRLAFVLRQTQNHRIKNFSRIPRRRVLR